jgi:glutathione S-transferase
VDVRARSLEEASDRAELLPLSPWFLVPSLEQDGVTVWDPLAIAEYLHELRPGAGLLPGDAPARAHCRSVSGEMHSGFANLRSAMPMSIRAHDPGFRVWTGAQADVDRIVAIWGDCLTRYGGPYLFGGRPTVADAMYAPVCSRFATYDVALEGRCLEYRDSILALDAMSEWTAAARAEPDAVGELEIEF